ncbi:hypothetical protein UFOVP1537_21 [uncultured Caudovirales phage]|uniref:Uncharacterized protein n=2 Tax=root TaxID=1 RepID=A0A6J7XLY3_9CAUD|nr:hypothetical protein UFOVP825_39 [uncultured Caudovirales phage]CAB4171228.1 hypothetical protein UFOVP915_21 [uncultured Caudovirales phage]CAB4177221.1 hypothetical protein UFOVP1000_38 [uncultured Caudovirales phage]CAB4182650.1 hypothetical protein UFOVP1092_13 [uncultured Caudovirales phage]CAB4187425.1 hypothetical protein UFOVP1152_17 [uncultured Caudovirales phage]
MQSKLWKVALGLTMVGCAENLPISKAWSVLDIPTIRQIDPKPIWRTYADAVVQCVGKPALTPYDSLHWFWAERIPDGFGGMPVQSSQIAVLTEYHVGNIVITPTLGDEKSTIKNAETHAMYQTGDESPEYFSTKCGNLVVAQ